MKLKNLSKESLPREKMIKDGKETLSNEELLAILINSGTKNESALELAYHLLANLDNIACLLKLDYYDLIMYPGIKDKKACTILAALELAKRAFSYQAIKETMDNPKTIYNALYPLVKNKKNETLYAYFLDVKLQLIKRIIVNEGQTNSIIVNKKRLAFEALQNGASFIILAHNHPSGDSTPSKADIKYTLELKDSLLELDIELIDHIVIGDQNYYSFNEHNLIT